MEIVNAVIDLVEPYEGEDNTYILMGNYLLDHPQFESYLHLHLINAGPVARKTKNFKWVIAIALITLPSNSISPFSDYADLISELISEATDNECFWEGIRLLKMLIMTIPQELYSDEINSFPTKVIDFFLN